MGNYLNPNSENFRRILNGKIYVDKTMMIAETNQFIDEGNNYICISRPRRFGKTIAGEMLSAYYSKGCDSRELFTPYKIAKESCFEEKLNRYNVIKIDMNSEYQNVLDRENLIRAITENIQAEMRQQFPDVEIPDNDSLPQSILRIYSATGETFIIIMDEYDVLVRDYLAYDNENQTCHIPNKEVRQEWFRAVSIMDEYKVTNQIIQESKQLLADTIHQNENAVEAALDESHIQVTSNRSYNNEDALQSAIYLAYIYALNQYTVIKEMTTGKGFADVVFIPFVENMPAMIIELKRNSSADSAIEQIRQKQYYASLSHYSGDLLFVGINYDEQNKTHECRIERFVK